jgi:Ran-binding protein 1
VKLLKHRDSGTCRLLMRRDKTLKICANHYVLPQLELKPNCGSDRAWVWSTPSDFADEEPKPELLAIRFANAENAQKFQEMFDEAKSIMKTKLSGQTGKTADSDASTDSKRTSSEKKTAEKLKECCVKYQNKTEKNAEEEEEDKGDDVKKNEDDKTTDGVAAELNKLKVKDSVEPDSGTISTPAAKKD